MLPRNPAEIDRLDVQHYALRAALPGNHLAEPERPGMILDVGSGTGQWAYDLCAEFPDALVVGLDLVPSKPDRRPANYRFVEANVVHGLPFADDRFDFVHQRLLVTALPVHVWPGVTRDLARVLRPGGWIELVEGSDAIEPSGPATRRLFDLARRLAAKYGLDTSGTVCGALDEYLRQAGMVEIEKQSVAIPLGDWGGRVGSLMASDFRAMFKSLCGIFEAHFELPVAEGQDLLWKMQEEWERYRTSYTFTFAFGRKPGAPVK